MVSISIAPLVALTALAPLAAAPSAQVLTDLQPGRNFVSVANFGTWRTAALDAGDVDNDGDLDVIVVNGQDGSPQANRLYINAGGLQGGVIGTFLDETAPRLGSMPLDRSRDVEFVDYDGDGDLDAFVANSGTTLNGGEVSRFYTNLGGLQGGTAGFFAEESDLRWGTLVAVPADQQVFGGNAGPFRDFSCDCEFADLDDDGDSDLFHGSYGPVISGTHDSRVFLNDGAGVFHELWPWANPLAETKTHTIDFDIVDLDGDFDLDIFMSSQSSATRVYQSNLNNGIPGSPALYHDITSAALVAQGAVSIGFSNYGVEPADLDGDGDIDVWAVNYFNFNDRILRNDGVDGNGIVRFTLEPTWIKGDPGVDEEEAEFGDFDNDGDLDVFSANFAGTNVLYMSGLAQGLSPSTAGLYHRTGISGGSSLAGSFPELPTSGNGNTTRSGDWADLDNDGDLDLMLGNDGNGQNYLFSNVLGVPDTHAPTIAAVRQIAPQPNGSPVVVHAEIRDNVAHYLHAHLDVRLHYSVDVGPEQQFAMFYQGGYTFRGVIPAQTDAAISYFVSATDPAGNLGISARFAYSQGSPASGWANLGGGLAGVAGIPQLVGQGLLVSGAENEISLTSAASAAAAMLWLSLADTPTSFKGGTLHAVPAIASVPLATDGSGGFALQFAWPAGIPSGFELFLQCGVQDGSAVQGVALSNLLRGTTP